MKHRFNIGQILQSAVGYKGLPFPAPVESKFSTNSYTGKDFKDVPEYTQPDTMAKSGEPLYKKDYLGNWYFMPVTFVHGDFEFEIDCALVSIDRSKKIIKTDLVSKRGSAKELISIQDYEIKIKGAVIGFDKLWPEDKLEQLNTLFEINEAIDIHCALTAVFLKPTDKVVITHAPILETKNTEHVQLIEITCLSDSPFELIIE